MARSAGLVAVTALGILFSGVAMGQEATREATKEPKDTPARKSSAPKRAVGPGANDARPDGSASGAAAKSFGPVKRLERELSPTASGNVEGTVAVETAETHIAPSDPGAGSASERKVTRLNDAAPSPAAAATPAATPDRGLTVDDAQLNELRACPAQVAAQRGGKKALAGKLTLRWTVRADGTVQDPEVVAVTGTDPAVMACVERRMAGWRFTRPAGAATDVPMTRTLAL